MTPSLPAWALLACWAVPALAADPAAPAAPDPVPAAVPAEAGAERTAPLQVQALDFRRGPAGAGRLELRLSAREPVVEVRPEGRSLVVELAQAHLPQALRRVLDVADLGSPVRLLRCEQRGDSVRLRLEAEGGWEHSVTQSEHLLVVELRPQRPDPNKPLPGPGYSGEKLSLNFQSIELRALLQVFADFTNLNLVASDTVTGSVTLRLKDVPWDQALDIVLQSKGLGLRRNGNVMSIAPKDEIAAREKADLEASRQIQELEPLRTQSFQLNYSKAEDLVRLLTGGGSGGASAAASAGAPAAGGKGEGPTASAGSRILSPRGSVGYELRTNQLFVTDVGAKLEEVGRILGKVDIPVRQVVIEARIVEASDSFGRSLGVRLGGLGRVAGNGGSPQLQVGGSYLGVQPTPSGSLGAPTPALYNQNLNFVNLPAPGLTTAPGVTPGTFALSLFNQAANRFLSLEISALEAEGKGKIVSSPRVVTADQIKATIRQGTQIPYQSAAPGAAGGTQVSFKDAVLKLEVTPQITPEGGILLDVDVSKDSRGQDTTAGPAIDTKQVRTQVLVENGGTVVIGGIFEQQDTENVNKVPVLGDLPGVGNLFKNRTRETRKTELLVFLTPKVIAERSGWAQ